MKKIIYSILCLSILLIQSCSDDPISTESLPVVISFASTSGIYPVPESGDTYEIVVGLTNTVNKDVTVTLNVHPDTIIVEDGDSVYSASEGSDYVVDSKTAVIKAGEYTTSFYISGNYENLTSTYKNIQFSLSADNEVSNANFNTNYDLRIGTYCPFDAANVAGTFTFVSNFFEGSWAVGVERIAGTTNYLLKDAYVNGYDIEVDLDDTDPYNIKATVDKQEIGYVHSTYGMVSTEGSGSYDVCSGTLNLELTFSVEAGSWSPTSEIAIKQ